MRRIAALTLAGALAAALAACGGTDGGLEPDESAPSSGRTTADEVPHEVLGIVNGVASGPARVTTRPTYVGDELALMRYVGRLDSDHVAAQLQELVAENDPPEGMVEAAVVIAQGCDVPPGVTVTETPRGFEVTPLKVTEPLKECVVATTSVAVLELPAEGFPDRGQTREAD